jgi:fructose-1,6-bisphosphatase
MWQKPRNCLVSEDEAFTSVKMSADKTITAVNRSMATLFTYIVGSYNKYIRKNRNKVREYEIRYWE